jgi:acyl transferase domain-containing protein/NAD(P)H-dependent flavin oxidoreductase YrpB (nitropropane dioxygenase family)
MADPGIAVAGSRAGALGVLDFGLGFEGAAVWQAAGDVARYLRRQGQGGRPGFGVRLPVTTIEPALLEGLPDALRVVVAVEGGLAGDVPDWTGALAVLEHLGVGIAAVAEVTSREAAKAAVEAGFGALIVAGHEAGGWGSETSSFVLLQAVLGAVGVPVWVRGGIGLYSAAACLAAGAAGVVLDGALLLARESALDLAARARLERWDGSETQVIGRGISRGRGPGLRVHALPGSPALGRLAASEGEGRDAWRRAAASHVGWGPGQVWPAGQDAAWAASLARRFVTVGGIVQAIDRAIDEALDAARRLRPLDEGAPLAAAHGTRYPIVQGPMTRVSDNVPFALAVAEGGGLPFLALALMRGPDVRALLADAAARLGTAAWGVGILGFVPPELRHEQMEEIRRARPPFALIAGGRPDQARVLEAEGIATYLHVPSPGLLRRFLKDGARRFVLEGRECGGHVGPRSSFVLWDQAAAVMLETLDGPGAVPAEELHVLYAGGIHDARSSAAVAALAAPLAARGVHVGVLVGTGYLFTAEAVATGAIVAGFQEEAIRCGGTVLLETGPGHEVRVSPSPFTERFEVERRQLLSSGRSAEEIRAALEALNAGRLRVAAKGTDRSTGAGSPLVAVPEPEQKERGLYMLGQAATLRDRITTIAALHRGISEGGAARLDQQGARVVPVAAVARARPAEVAIIGMAAMVPGAGDVRAFWENTLRGHDAITEVPADRWDWRLYFDADPKAPDKITSRWGGFVPDIPFDPLRYGMPPASLPSIEPLQMLTLEAVRSALDDAGYRDRPFPRERTAVVLGAGGGAAQLAMGYAFRSYLPLLGTVIPGAGKEAQQRCGELLPEWTEDSFPGILLNVAAGRVANRFDLGGANYTVDAACGSSLAAAAAAVRELETGAADMVLLGGADTVQNPFTYLAFSKTHAFSARGRCRPFDAGADGIVISEAVCIIVLKRLADAERDGDRVYAVIQGLGASSDGRAKGLTAPRPEGQMRALVRAYERSGITPDTVGYVEAHGTGTAAGDLSEVTAMSDVFRAAGAARGGCALGSVKSLIGHTKCAAGLAGMINAALALHHRVLPPTIGVAAPNPRVDFASTPFHINTKLRPWLHATADHPRRAGVSAFGFGGTNFHAVLEAYEGDPHGAAAAPLRDWAAELFVWRAADAKALAADVDRLRRALAAGARPALRDVAYTLWTELAGAQAPGAATGAALAIVAGSLEDLRGKLDEAADSIARGDRTLHDPRGIDYAAEVLAPGRLALVFPGQGAQTPDMLIDLAVAFDEVRGGFETIDGALAARGRPMVGPLVFPPPAFSDAERQRQRTALAATEVAQPALGGASLGLLRLLENLGVAPEMVAGHSYGELVALYAAGALGSAALAELSEARGRFLNAAVAAGDEPGTMAALAAGPEQVEAILEGITGAGPVNWNGPRQTVISGGRGPVGRALEQARRLGVRGQILPVACAFHSPLVAGAREPLAEMAANLGLKPPRLPVYSNVTAAPYPSDPGTIADQLGDHLASPVRFAEMIEAMHAGGARVFVEVGPGSTLTGLIGSILGDRPHLAVACDPPGRRGIPGLLHALARLFVAGLPVQLGRLTAGRSACVLDADRLTGPNDPEPLPPSAWLVNGNRARPAFGPERPRFGPGPALERPATRPTPTATQEPAETSTPTPPYLNGTARIEHPHPSANGSGKLHDALNVPPRWGAAIPAASGELDDVVAEFQRSMQKFLEIQRSTMLALLSGPDAAPPSSPEERVAEGRMRTDASPQPPLVERIPQERLPVDPPPQPPLAGGVSEAPVKADPTPQRPVQEGVAGRLLAIVRERTGYPVEMLGLDLDIEADLGIDSIKRVEILGSLRDGLPALASGPAGEAELMDQLARARTMGEIVARLERALGKVGSKEDSAGATGQPSPGPRPPSHEDETRGEGSEEPAVAVQHLNGRVLHPEPSDSPVRRMVLEIVEAPLDSPRHTAELASGGIVLVTDDGRGVARAFAADLKARGYRVIRVKHGVAPGSVAEADGTCLWADLTSPAAVATLLDRVRERGRLAALVHALPLGELPPSGLDLVTWSARMGPELRGLFLLVRAGAESLCRAAREGGACLIAATGLGGGFASAGTAPDDFFPGHGGIAGLVKTLAREWPEVRARVVDLDPRGDVEMLAANLVSEFLAADERIEVGYLDRRRVALAAVEAPLARVAPPGGGIELAPEEPIVVTGGARGITAAVAADLARRWRPTLLLVGTSPLPPEREDPATTAIDAGPALKAVLHDQLSRQGHPFGPADLERAYQSLRRQREIRANLGRLRDAGATVAYSQADVRDAAVMRRVLDDWQHRFGPIAGLIHGAGVIHDRWLRDKSPEAFDRVLGTKIEGALTLAGLLDPEALRFAAFFSSVAGRFGNRGQSDYAAANETLNKLALWLDRRWAGRVVSVIWGPWSGVGMVSDLEAHLGRRGLGMIPPAVGATKLGDELERGAKGDVEVIVAGELGSLLEGPGSGEATSSAAHREPATETEACAEVVAATLSTGGVVR